MESSNNSAHFETTNVETTTRRWLALIGLGVALVAMVSCLMAAAGIGGFLWLRNARQLALTPTAIRALTPDPATAGGSGDLSAGLPAPPITSASHQQLVNRIVFVDPAGRLGTVAPDGAVRRLLNSSGVRYQFPAWAPDGNRIAAVGANGNEGGVYVWADEADSERTTLFASGMRPPIYLYWSPDGRQVSFLANERSSLGLWLADANGAAPARQIASGQPFYWDWSQGGDLLFIHSGGSGPDAQLAFLDPGADRIGNNVARPGLFQAPGISAGGRFLAYSQVDDGRFLVAVEDRSGGQRITVPHTGIAALGWSPAAPQLAWTSPRSDQLIAAGPLRLLNAETGETKTLVQDTVFAFFWSPDGGSIAYLTLAGDAADPGAARYDGRAALLQSQQTQHSRLSLRLGVVDVTNGQQRQLYTFRPSPVFLSQFLPFFDQYALSHRLWSPASDAIVLPMLEDGGASGIYVIALETGEATRIADGTMAFWSWQ